MSIGESKSRAFLLSMPPSLERSPFMSATELDAAVGKNTGNLAFVHAIFHQLGGRLPRLDRRAPLEAVNAMDGVAVLPCANHLNAARDLAGEADRFERIERPIVAIGLGAQASSNMAELPELPAGSQRWLRALADHAPGNAPNITVRGELTLRLLDKYGVAHRAVALGCPSHLLHPSARLGREVASRFERPIERVAVAAGAPGWRSIRRLEASLARLVEQTSGAYVVQSPLEVLKAQRGEWEALQPSEIEGLCDTVLPGRSTEELVSWFKRYAIAFFGVPEWMSYLRQFDFVVGPRFHGISLAIQAGVPALCLAHDARLVELCETSRIPYVRVGDLDDDLDLTSLRRLFRFDPDDFDSQRVALASRYVHFLRDNGLEPAAELVALASAPAEAPITPSP